MIELPILELGRAAFNEPDQKRATVALGGQSEVLDEILVTDPYVAADYDAYVAVRDYVHDIELRLRSASVEPLVERQSEHPYGRDSAADQTRSYSPYTHQWLATPGNEAMAAWRSLVPHARALNYLQGIRVGDPIVDRFGSSTPATPATAAQLRYVDDAVGIRARAAAMRWIAQQHLQNHKRSEVSWLSLACGTAEPSLSAADSIHEELGLDFDLYAFDYDQDALDAIKKASRYHSPKHRLHTYCGDLLGDDFAVDVCTSSGLERFDVVEDLGFKEYLPEPSDSLGAFRHLEGILPNASDFTAGAWDLVAPGGILISGNMILDRPQRDFVFGVVAWPIINARTIKEIRAIYEASGVLQKDASDFQVYLVREAVSGSALYALAVARKSA